MHKHRNLIDEIFCQLVKQLTDNRSHHKDSIQRGWKLMTIVLNYFLPSEHLRIYLFRYLHDQGNQQQRLGKDSVKADQLESSSRVGLPSSIVDPSLRANVEVWRTENHSEQSRDRSAHCCKRRSREKEMVRRVIGRFALAR